MQRASTSYLAVLHRRATIMAPDPVHGSREHLEGQPIRVLLISDLLLLRPGIRHLLDSAGIRLVGEAGTRGEALSLAAAEHPDVIVVYLDSRTEAFECIEALVATAPESRIIALSDRRNAGDHHVLVELGALGLVFKHERPEVLIKAIRKVSAGEVWLDRTNTAEVLSRVARRRHSEDLEAAKISTLTRREHEIIALVGEGLKSAVIAQRLFISEATVRNHLTSILGKLGLSNRFELAVYAFRQGMVRYPATEGPRQD